MFLPTLTSSLQIRQQRTVPRHQLVNGLPGTDAVLGPQPDLVRISAVSDDARAAAVDEAASAEHQEASLPDRVGHDRGRRQGSARVQHSQEDQRVPDRKCSRDSSHFRRRVGGPSVSVELAGVRCPAVALRRAAEQVLVKVQLCRQVCQPGQRVDAKGHCLHRRRRLQVCTIFTAMPKLFAHLLACHPMTVLGTDNKMLWAFTSHATLSILFASLKCS